jgi:hypothetical protein
MEFSTLCIQYNSCIIYINSLVCLSVTGHSDPLICEADSATPQLTKTRSRKPGAGRGGGEKLETKSHCLFSDSLDRNQTKCRVVRGCVCATIIATEEEEGLGLSVCDGGFGGWGRERPVKQRATGVSL